MAKKSVRVWRGTGAGSSIEMLSPSWGELDLCISVGSKAKMGASHLTSHSTVGAERKEIHSGRKNPGGLQRKDKCLSFEVTGYHIVGCNS